MAYVTISVFAKCESMTQTGTKCRKDATVYEPRMGALATWKDIHSNSVPVSGPQNGSNLYDGQYNAIPTGFRCNSHSREGLAEANRRWMENNCRRYRS